MEHRIKELIKEKGYTQEAFARKVGTSRVGLAANLKNPSGSTLEKYAQVLGVPIWQLFVNPDEIIPTQNSRLICPHCGKPLKVMLE